MITACTSKPSSVASRKGPRPVERPTSIVRTTRPDVFVHDTIRKPRVTLPAVDARRLVTRRRQLSIRFTADVEIPLMDAAYLQRIFGESSTGLECFVSLAVQNGVEGRQPARDLPEPELWVVVSLRVSLPMTTVRDLNTLTTDPELMAATLSRFIRLEIAERQARLASEARRMGAPLVREGFSLFRGN